MHDKKTFERILDNKRHNKLIIDYYDRLAMEYEGLSDTILSRQHRLDNCQSYWLLDQYTQLKIRDIKKISLCKDKYCSNCKKVKQSYMLNRYYDLINDQEHIYHMVLTVPNCKGVDLKDTIDKINKSFYMLTRYLRGDKKIKGLDFGFLGYKGVIRSLEVTYQGDSYHPHLHVIISGDGNVIDDKVIVNKYSYSYNKLNRKFCNFEILIQKIWYMLVQGIRVTKKAILELDVGYSCIIDPVREEDYLEIFKYVVKNTDEQGNLMSYEQFKTLYFALHRKKQIQGYGCFYNIKDNTDLELIGETYEKLIAELQKKEKPLLNLTKSIEALVLDNGFKYISKYNFSMYEDLLKDDD